MIKYHLAALALKCFSSNKTSRSLYRGLGNWLGGKKRANGKMPFYYFDRLERNIATCIKYGPLRADDVILELGTGWLNWNPLPLRLFFVSKVFLYNFWKTRRLAA